jgi:uncharacterized repeat protein (TIGR01451 family)
VFTRSRLARTILVGAASMLALGGATSASATVQGTTILSAPLSVGMTPDLNCSVDHAGDTSGEFFGDTACATVVSTITPAAAIYGPASIPAGGALTGAPGYSAFIAAATPPALAGAGTVASPYTLTTVVTGGPIQVTQVDSYVAGSETYRTDVTLKNIGATATTGVLSRGGDCYLQNSDSGLGAQNNTTGAVACIATPDSPNPSRIEEWVPLTPGSTSIEGAYSSEVWTAFGTGNLFPNTCTCTVQQDNGAGIAWAYSLAVGASATFSHQTTFSPTGNQVNLTKTASTGLTTPGGRVGYTITATNPNAGTANLTTLTEHLPAGFAYVPGSTTGATTTDPAIVGSDLTWTLAAAIPSTGTAVLGFQTTASAAPGRYTDSADGAGSGGVNVVGTGPTALVVVATPPTITGNPIVGSVLTCHAGNFPPPITSATYTWTRNGVTIPGATRTTYTPVLADNTRQVACVETAVLDVGTFALASAPVTVGLGATPASSPPVVTIQATKNGFAIAVIYRARLACPKKKCQATAEIRNRVGKPVFTAATKALPGDGKIVFGSRTKLTLPQGKKVHFLMVISKKALLKAKYTTKSGYRITQTRLRVVLKTKTGKVVTIRDGQIRVSIKRIKSGALPGLKSIL